jgi:hypothetical protein
VVYPFGLRFQVTGTGWSMLPHLIRHKSKSYFAGSAATKTSADYTDFGLPLTRIALIIDEDRLLQLPFLICTILEFFPASLMSSPELVILIIGAIFPCTRWKALDRTWSATPVPRFGVHLVIQAVISSLSHLCLATSLNDKLLSLIGNATVWENRGQIAG